MSGWIEVTADAALADGEHVVVEVDGSDVAVFKVAGRCYALADVCSHDGGELASGELDGDVIVCPRHGARFCLASGRVLSAPAYEDIDSYPVRVVDGRIEVADTPAR